MIPVTAYEGQDVAVLGLARTGLAAAAALRAGGARVHAWDDAAPRREAATAEGVPIAAPSQLDWGRMAALVMSPGIPHTHPNPHPAAEAARKAQHDYVLSLVSSDRDHRAHLSFKVARPAIARIEAMIQNRMTMVGSSQPFFSK